MSIAENLIPANKQNDSAFISSETDGASRFSFFDPEQVKLAEVQRIEEEEEKQKLQEIPMLEEKKRQEEEALKKLDKWIVGTVDEKKGDTDRASKGKSDSQTNVDESSENKKLSSDDPKNENPHSLQMELEEESNDAMPISGKQPTVSLRRKTIRTSRKKKIKLWKDS